MNRFFGIIFLIFFTHWVQAQSEIIPEWQQFDQERLLIQRKSMVVLGSWAVGNMMVGGIGASQTSGEAKYFHQMNLLWNTVNLGLALPGYLSSFKNTNNPTPKNIITRQYQSEKILLFNSGIDLAYIATGMYLIERGNSQAQLSKQDRLSGFGKGLILQGAFLFIYDLATHQIHTKHRKRKLPIIP